MRGDRRANDRAWEWRGSRTVKWLDELHAKGQILATLRWEGFPSKRAYARWPEGEWVFDRPRRTSKEVEVRTAGSDTPVALFRPNWTGDGTLQLAGGRTLRWTYGNFMQTQWAFYDSAGKRLVRFQDNSRLFERTATVEVVSSALSRSDRALLALLGRYLMVQRSRDTTSAIAGQSFPTGIH